MDIELRYEFVRELGHGAYGVAQLVKDRATGELVAVKFMERGERGVAMIASRCRRCTAAGSPGAGPPPHPPPPAAAAHRARPAATSLLLPLPVQVDKNVEREILNHRHLSGHTNIVQFKEVFLTSTHLGIAMEYASGGMLFDRIVKMTRLKEDIARYFFQQLVCGVAWCHSKHILAVQYSVPLDKPLSADCLDLIARIFVASPPHRITLQQIRQHPWYTKNLPRECQNDGVLLQCAPPSQTAGEVTAIVVEAGTRLHAAREADARQQQEQHQEFNEEEMLADMAEDEGFLD